MGNRCDNFKLQKAQGADVELLNPQQLTSKFPWLNVEDVSLGCFGHSGEGWFDPWALLTAFRRKAIGMGVEYVEEECCGMQTTHNAVTSVQLRSGRSINCATVVNAAGGWANEVCEFAGIIGCPVRRRKRMIFVVHCPTGPVLDCPLVVDPSGVYFRREGSGGNFICGEW